MLLYHIKNFSPSTTHVWGMSLFCMPGNPLSVFAMFLYLVLPYLWGLAGKEQGNIRLECVASPCDFSPYPRTRFLFARKRDDVSHPSVIHLLPEQSSAAIENLRDAEGTLIVPANMTVARNSHVQFLAFNQFAIL